MTIAEMKKRRQELGYSMKQLSEKSGVPVSTINKIFNGYTKSPRYETLQALSKALTEDIEKGQSVYGCRNNTSFVREGQTAYEADYSDMNSVLKRTLVSTLPEGDYTVRERKNFPEERRTELINGVVYDMASPTRVHQDIVGTIYMQIRQCIEKNNSSCKAYVAPLDVILGDDGKTVVQPDVLVMCHEEEGDFIQSAPEFIAEVLSPSTRAKDLLIKLPLYGAYGVQEYWIVDPDERSVMVYHLADLQNLSDHGCQKITEIFDFDADVPLGISGEKCTINLHMI